MDCITDLDDSESSLLEALQLSLPADMANKKVKQRDKKLSLNPIYRQVPRVVDCCCQHLEKYGSHSSPLDFIFSLPIHLLILPNCVKMYLTFSNCRAGLQTVGIFRVGSSKKRVRQV